MKPPTLTPETLKPLVNSAVRWIVPLAFGRFGFQPTEAQFGEIAAWIVAGILLLVSLLWSGKENEELLKAPTPKELK